MSPQRFLILSVITGAAFAGAGMAVTNRFQPLAPRTAQPQSAVAVSPAPMVPPVGQSVQLVQPTQPATAVSPLHFQLKQAIQERNLILLKSLMRAGALRDSLPALDISEQETLENFEKLDASTWKILDKALDKAIDYHCRRIAQTNAGSACFE